MMSKDMLLAFLVFYPMIAAILSYLIGKKSKTARDYFADFVVISEFAVILGLFLFVTMSGEILQCRISQIAGFGLKFQLDGFRSIYALVAGVMWMMTTVFSKEYFAHYRNRNRYYLFLLLTLGAMVGVFLSADLFTTFLFFEMMSFTSYVWVAHDEQKASLRAAETYLAIAVIGGMAMLMGLFLLYHALGTLEISALMAQAAVCEKKGLLYAAGICISIGFGAKAGAFPLHIWLPKAHPVAPAPASALLSGILTKSGIFGLLIVSCNLFFADAYWGSAMLLFGSVTMFLGAFLALFSVDLKRTLACSSMSQIGFIMVGIGMQSLLGEENVLAARGTLLHMVNHSVIKLVLFMAAGVIFMNVHKLNLNEIRGFGRKKPLLHFIFLMGALGIGGIPLFNGFISKSLLHEGIVEYTALLQAGAAQAAFLSVANIKQIEWLFLVSGGMTVAYMAKLYIAIFVEKNPDEGLQKSFDEKKSYMNAQSMAALTISALLIPLMGFLPNTVMDFLADRGTDLMHAEELTERISYFSLENLKGAGISIGIGIALYLVVIRLLLMKKSQTGAKEYVNRWPKWLDLENGVYRPLITALCAICGFVCRVLDSLVDTIVVFLRKTVYRDKALPFELAEGTPFTYSAGKFFNLVHGYLKKKYPKKKFRDRDFVHEFAMLYVSFRANESVITRTLSFGLLMFCAGFVLTVVYLLIVHW